MEYPEYLPSANLQAGSSSVLIFLIIAGLLYLLRFECVLCGCQLGLTLDSKGEVDREVIIPPQLQRA